MLVWQMSPPRSVTYFDFLFANRILAREPSYEERRREQAGVWAFVVELEDQLTS